MQISEVHLLTNTLSETEYFYKNKLEMKMLDKTDELLCFYSGNTKLFFHLSNAISNPKYHFAFDIPENKLIEAMEWCRKRTDMIVFESNFIIDFINWNAKSFYFYDNNGNILECIVRYDLGNTSEETFTGNSFLNISEIGFVVDDVFEFCEAVNSKFKTDYFIKQPKKENFSVLGDNNGLFIVSGKSRNWFPTRHKAKPFWSKVVFENFGKQHELVFDP